MGTARFTALLGLLFLALPGMAQARQSPSTPPTARQIAERILKENPQLADPKYQKKAVQEALREFQTIEGGPAPGLGKQALDATPQTLADMAAFYLAVGATQYWK